MENQSSEGTFKKEQLTCVGMKLSAQVLDGASFIIFNLISLESGEIDDSKWDLVSAVNGVICSTFFPPAGSSFSSIYYVLYNIIYNKIYIVYDFGEW